MQTEEIVPRAHSTGLGGPISDLTTPFQQSVLITSPIEYPEFINMAVKQEPQEEEERARQQVPLSPQLEIDDAQAIPDGELNHKRVIVKESVSELYNPRAQVPQQNGCKKPISRGRRKTRWKLKFHHQALPPEYLDHYEATMAQEAAQNSSATFSTDTRITSPISTSSQPPSFTPSASNQVADVQSWLQRLASMQNDIYVNPLQFHQMSAASNLSQSISASRRSVITSAQSNSHLLQPAFSQNHSIQRSANPLLHNSPRPPMKYSDLPYMGEITLDNCKPRRGRKPKKADICHLIYKNYGTILPGTPGIDDKSKISSSSVHDLKVDLKDAQMPFQRTDIQNRISSLLEKRLTQERRALEISVDSTKEQEEPLNLCIRDLNLLKIRLSDKYGGVFGSCQSKSDGSSDVEDVDYVGTSAPSIVESEHQNSEASKDPSSPDRTQTENPVSLNTHEKSNHSNGSVLNCSHDVNGTSNDSLNNNDTELKQNREFVYWPNTGVFIHPVALQSQFLYYQKMAQDKDAVALQQTSKEQRIVPKPIYSMLDTSKLPGGFSTAASPILPDESIVEQPTTPTTPSPRPKRNSTSQNQCSNQPIKRKRSAIFIPPMPTENNNNPATEVSICKFKFTGGAKPSLQEKKSLSVDSGGNFRYYSGTGDKSMRGYEFFPRESLQQTANQSPNSSTGAFLSATSERVSQTVPTPRPCSIQDDRRKRKSRKSVQREKLEQTFKEKGFLIQTQQLESAEGATYCKFRQLRKFTRYLFRSWKDYLPGNVRELNEAGEPIGPLKEVEHDREVISTSSLATTPSVELQQSLLPNSPPTLSFS